MNYEMFSNLFADLTDQFVKEAYPVHTGTWQGVDISKRPEAQMMELLNVSFTVTHAGRRPIGVLAQATGCNMPWAEDHFQERVCGQPINPGVEWANWPWANKAGEFRGKKKTMPGHDWAYLAAIIDGEGSISIRTANEAGNKYPRVKITQVDEAFITSLHNKFGVGTLRPYSSPSNQLSDRQSYIWRISGQSEVRWVLEGCMPYLRLKREKAVLALRFVEHAAPLMDEAQPFNHNYMERYWCKQAGMNRFGDRIPHRGIYHPYGDLNDVVNLLGRDPLTRQAYMPVFFPEDTGAVHGERVPCTLGYHLIVRNGELHMVYYLRSCDFVRHMRDDIYLSVRLQQWVLDKLRERFGAYWSDIRPGSFTMHITSLHCFINDFRKLQADHAKNIS